MSELLKRVSHPCFATPDLDRFLAFYSGILGCRIIHTFSKDDGQVYGYFLLVGNGTFLEVFLGPIVVGEHPPFRHLCFEVQDIHAVAERLGAAGMAVNIRRGRTDRVLLVETKDPDGRDVEFHQYDEQSMQFPFMPERSK